MDGLIVSDANGKELRELLFTSYDFEVGEDDNSFKIVFRRGEYETIPKGARIYLPGTEFGGLFRELDTNTEQDTIAAGGLTWRGMMAKKIIVPASGQDYATDTGELNAIVKRRVEAALPGLFIGSNESTGVTVSGYQYERYCTLEDGLKKLLKSVGYRLNIEYSQTDKAVIVSAVPIEDYSDDLEFSSDMRLNYLMHMQGDGVNHLICLGNGELRNRTVYHLYVDQNGNIGTTPYYTGIDEIAAVYDYAGAELVDLITLGTQRLQELMNQNTFEIKVDPTMSIAVGDIVGGRDYLSGMTMTAPISGKIVRWAAGFRSVEYKLADDVTATLFSNVANTLQAVKSANLLKANAEALKKNGLNLKGTVEFSGEDQ